MYHLVDMKLEINIIKMVIILINMVIILIMDIIIIKDIIIIMDIIIMDTIIIQDIIIKMHYYCCIVNSFDLLFNMDET